MNQRNQPDEDEGEHQWRAESKNALKIFPESHSGESDGRGKPDRRGNDSGHETERRVINLGKKMIFAAGTRQGRAQLAVGKGAAKRGDAANDPQHEECEPGMYIRQLKPEAGEDAR